MRWGKIRRAASEGSHRRHIAAAPTILIPSFAPLLDDHHGDASSSSSSSAEKGEKTVVDYSIGEVGDRAKDTCRTKAAAESHTTSGTTTNKIQNRDTTTSQTENDPANTASAMASVKDTDADCRKSSLHRTDAAVRDKSTLDLTTPPKKIAWSMQFGYV